MTFALALLLKVAAVAYPGPYPPGGSCNVGGKAGLCIAAPASSNAVLQRAPARAAVYGSVSDGYGAAGGMEISVALTKHGDADDVGIATVTAPVRRDNTWKALLPPQPTFGNFSLTAGCTKGCAGANATAAVSLVNLTFGDVYVCSGQVRLLLSLLVLLVLQLSLTSSPFSRSPTCS